MRDIGIAHILQRPDRPAAAGAVDHANQRQAIFVRHRLALDELAVQRRIGRAATHGEIVGRRSEEHTSELQSLMRISYAVFCLKKKTTNYIQKTSSHIHIRTTTTSTQAH